MRLFIIFIFMFFATINCFAQQSLKVKTILGKYKTTYRMTEKGDSVMRHQLVADGEIYEPQINIKTQKAKQIEYELKGHNSSGGLSINKIKKIRTEQEIIDNILVIRHYAVINGIPGKEGNNVLGYNYVKENHLKIPKNIMKVKIELYHEFTNQRITKPMKLMKEIEVNLK